MRPSADAAIWRSIVGTSAAKAYTLVAGIASLALTARWLGPEGRGLVAAVTTWATLAFSFSYLSLGQVAIHHVSGASERDWLPSLGGSLAAAALALTLAGWTAVAAIYAVSDGAVFGGTPPLYLAIAFAALPFLIWEQYGSTLLTAVGALSRYNRAVIAGRTVSLVGIVVLVALLRYGVAGALLAALAGQVVVAAGGLRYLRSLSAPWKASLATMRTLISGGAKLHMNAVGSFLFSSAAILMLQFHSGARETGFYQLAVQLTTLFFVPAQSAAMVLYGKVAELGADAAWAANRRVLVLATAVLTAGAAVAALVSPWLIPLLAGREFLPSVRPFQILMLSIPAMSIATIMAPQWIGRGFFWRTSMLGLFAGLLNVALNAVVIPVAGMHGAAWVTVATYGATMVVNLWLAFWIERRGHRGAGAMPLQAVTPVGGVE